MFATRGKAFRRSVTGGALLVAILALTPAGAAGPQFAPAPAGAAEPIATTVPSLPPPPATTVAPAAVNTPSADCVVGGFVGPTGSFIVAAAPTTDSDDNEAVTFSVEIESGLPVDIDCFAAVVDDILNDPRGWGLEFRQVEQEADVVIRLASPDTTDLLCYPLRTANSLSCANERGATLNFMRWSFGAEAFGEDLAQYRSYLVTHEVGHLLGHNHVSCPGVGDPAPVMMQQTKGVSSCIAQPWPLEWERR